MRTIVDRSKLPLLVLVYPGLSLLILLAISEEPIEATSVLSPHMHARLTTIVTWALAVLVALSFAFMLAVPPFSARYRASLHKMPSAFRRGLYGSATLIAAILPLQALCLALALFLADPNELWFWGIFIVAGAVLGTIILLRSGLGQRPDIYMTLRALRLGPNEQPKFQKWLRELSEELRVSLPQHVLLGTQPELVKSVGTIFSPDGELEGGAICFSMTTCQLLTVDEFRALAGEALLEIHESVKSGRKDFLSSIAGAEDVIRDLQGSMEEWSWLPKRIFHPVWLVVRLIVIAAMRFPLYLGKEWLVFYCREFWLVRHSTDLDRAVSDHFAVAEDVGTVPTISALVKEAAASLGLRYALVHEGKVLHPLGEVIQRIVQHHQGLQFATGVPPSWQDPVSAWNYLQFRCNLSEVNLEWCRRMALEVNPEPSAISLFENLVDLQKRLEALMALPLVVARKRENEYSIAP